MPLVINSLGVDTQTRTHKHGHTNTHTQAHRHSWIEAILRNQARAGLCAPGLKITVKVVKQTLFGHQTSFSSPKEHFWHNICCGLKLALSLKNEHKLFIVDAIVCRTM